MFLEQKYALFNSRAIELDGRNAVYYCNRAAAHSKLNQHQAAINDCKKAIVIDPSYSKAYGRMGYSNSAQLTFFLYLFIYLILNLSMLILA